MQKSHFKQYKESPSDLRKICLQYRNKLTPENRENIFKSVLKNLFSFSPFKNSHNVLAYYGKLSSGEFDTFQLLDYLISNKKLYLPKSNLETQTLDIYQIQSLNTDLELGSYKIMEPLPERCKMGKPDEIDLVIVPGSVFDETGGRYGYGAGYYDSFLKHFQGIKIALASDQLVMPFPLKLHENDVKMDFIITENNIYGN